MTQIWALTQKELKGYFVSPIAYIVTAMFLLLSGYFFVGYLFNMRDAGIMRNVFGVMSSILLFMGPMISMRLFAEEQRSKTLELLLTSPISDGAIVIAKFLAAALLLLMMLAVTLHYPITLMLLGNPDMTLIIAGYIGLFGMGCCFLAIGMLTSTWTQNQIISAVSSFVLSLLFLILFEAERMVGGNIGAFLKYLALNTHFMDFSRGLIKLSDILYYFSFVGILLFITTRSLETRRWK